MKNDFTRAIFGKTSAKEIIAYFKNGQNATYTMEIFNALKTDNAIEFIIDAETGEILYAA